MRTYLLYINERQTDVDYWVDVITGSGPMILMDDITGLCKFAMLSPDAEAEALRIATGIDVTGDELAGVVMRTFLRGYANERRRGFGKLDYVLPEEAHGAIGDSGIDVFNTQEFFDRVQAGVMDTLDDRAEDAHFATA